MSDDIEELKAAVEALQSKNKELIGELRKAKAKGTDIDPDAYASLQSEVEELRSQLDKTTKGSKTEIEKLTRALAEKDGALQNYLIDGGLTEALAKANVRPELMDAAKALLRGKTAIKAEGGQYQALMGDKAIAEAVAEWAAGDAGKHFVAAPANSGGGAAGTGATNAATPKGNLGGDRQQRTNAIAARFPELAANT